MKAERQAIETIREALANSAARYRDPASHAHKKWYEQAMQARAALDLLTATLNRAERAEKALRQVRGVFPHTPCSQCEGFRHEIAEANSIIDAALTPGGKTG